MSVREPAVAGMFYTADGLREEVEGCFLGPHGPGTLPVVNQDGPRRIVGLVSPHAGLMYSGGAAAYAYHALAEDGLPEVAVVIGPNHRSYLPHVALSDDAAWRTPMGESPLDREIIAKVQAAYPEAVVNIQAHAFEHSIEVQLPFLQYIGRLPGGRYIRIVPVLIGAAAEVTPGGVLRFAREFGAALAGALSGVDAVVIASTDFTHYESGETARAKDSRAISMITSLDEEGLLRTVDEYDISMCGAVPSAVMIAACRELGASSARELAYMTSGDVTGDRREVVGYGAAAVSR